MPEAYFQGPHGSCSAVKALGTNTACSRSPDSAQCICNGDYPQEVIDSPPTGYTRKTFAQATAQRVAWSAMVDTGEK